MRTRSSPSTPDGRQRSEPWTMLPLVRTTARYLEEQRIPEPRLSAEHLLAAVVGCSRLDLYLQFDRPVSESDLARYRAAVKRRLRHEPVAYIIGRATFRDLDLHVDSRVLIPRPETERLVDEVVDWAEGETRVGRAPAAGWRMADVGTGSGAIACALATELTPTRWIIGIDRSPDAIAVARANAVRTGADTTRWCVGDGLTALGPHRALDAVIANLPYVAERDRDDLERQVVGWEPEDSLFGGDDGLAVLRRVVRAAPDHLRNGGLLALEFGDGQGDRVIAMVSETPGLSHAATFRDLRGIERGVLAFADG